MPLVDPESYQQQANELQQRSDMKVYMKEHPDPKGPDGSEIDEIVKGETWQYGRDDPAMFRYEIDKPTSLDASSAPVSDAASGKTVVATTAIRTFADHMDQYVDELKRKASGMRDQSPVRAGAFPSARSLSKSTEDLRAGAATAIDNTIRTFTELRDKMAKVAIDYDSMEEANGITAAKLNEIMSEVDAHITTVGQSHDNDSSK